MHTTNLVSNGKIVRRVIVSYVPSLRCWAVNTGAVVKRALQETDEIVQAQNEAEHADAGFDGGEFSGPAHAGILERMLNRKAQEYGFVDFDALQDEAEKLGLVSFN